MLAAVAILGLAACSSKDYYDADLIARNKMAAQKTQYETNFETAFGQVASNQSWDFSTCEPRLGTRAGEEQEITTKLVAGLDFSLSYEIDVQTVFGVPTKYSLKNRKINKNKDLYDNVVKKLPDATQHLDVKTATLVAPSSSFTIYPVSVQGAWTHDLYVKVGDAAPVKLYSKTWTDYSRPYVNGEVLEAKLKEVTKTEEYEDWVWDTPFRGHYETKTREVFDHYDYEATETAAMVGLHIEAPVGTPIEIYLDNVKHNNSKKPSVGTSTGNVIYVDGNGAKPEGVELRDDAIIKYVGIEDQQLTNKDCDFDYNDVVLAIVGNPDVPEEIIIENDEYDVPTSITKRYMIEDLGSTDDFDFNDIVVDVTETTVAHHKVTIVDGVKTSDVVESTTKTQKAVIRHLGGTLPFQLTIGDTQLDEMQGVLGSDPDAEFTVTGWIPAQNNVSISVKAKDSEMYTVVNFPKTGAIPMIFACNDDVEWAAERVKFNFDQFPGYNSAQ